MQPLVSKKSFRLSIRVSYFARRYGIIIKNDLLMIDYNWDHIGGNKNVHIME